MAAVNASFLTRSDCWCRRPKFIATYDLAPEMSAFKITEKLLAAIAEGDRRLHVNFANPDMVGHTGMLDKTIEACQYVDTCLGKITKAIQSQRGISLIRPITVTLN